MVLIPSDSATRLAHLLLSTLIGLESTRILEINLALVCAWGISLERCLGAYAGSLGYKRSGSGHAPISLSLGRVTDTVVGMIPSGRSTIEGVLGSVLVGTTIQNSIRSSQQSSMTGYWHLFSSASLGLRLSECRIGEHRREKQESEKLRSWMYSSNGSRSETALDLLVKFSHKDRISPLVCR